MNKSPTGAQSVLRAIRLLKAFTLDKRERDIRGLAEETGLRRGTVHRLVAALVSEGLLTKAADKGKYRLGPTAAVLGVRALRSSALRESAHPELVKLARQTGETATLEVLTEGKMLILDEVLGDRLVSASPSLGTAWELHATSTGKALLATFSKSRFEASIAEALPRFTDKTLTGRDEWVCELETITERGFAIAWEELEAGYAAVGAVVRTPMEDARAALSVGGPSDRLDRDTLVEIGALVKASAEAVSARLGFEGDHPVATRDPSL